MLEYKPNINEYKSDQISQQSNNPSSAAIIGVVSGTNKMAFDFSEMLE